MEDSSRFGEAALRRRGGLVSPGQTQPDPASGDSGPAQRPGERSESSAGVGEDDVLAEGAVVFEVRVCLTDVLKLVHLDRSEAGGAGGDVVEEALQDLGGQVGASPP